MSTAQAVDLNLNFNLMLLHKLTADLSDDHMGAQPTQNLNHPTWQLGHLVYSVGAAAELLGARGVVPEGYPERYGMGSTCQPVGDADPDKQTLLNQLDAVGVAIRERVPDATQAQLDATFPIAELRELTPTVGHGLVFLTGGHFSYHLGQLSAWRRTVGLGPVLGM